MLRMDQILLQWIIILRIDALMVRFVKLNVLGCVPETGRICIVAGTIGSIIQNATSLARALHNMSYGIAVILSD